VNSDMNESLKGTDREKVFLLGVMIDVLSLDQLLIEMRSYILDGRKIIASYVNIHSLNIAYSLPWFKLFLNQSQLKFCDGVGVKFAARLTGQRLYDRFTPPDFMDLICELAIKNDWRIFFLGAKPGVAKRAADRLVDRHPGLQVGTHHGFFDKAVDSRENQTVIKEINSLHPQILVIGLGMPLQEKWILDNINDLDIRVAFPAGALFDYLADELPRAPRWMTDNGLEWLGRLAIEPRRLWRRYLIGNPLFFWRVFVHHILRFPLPN
jgi:N-acetylglucosaminyldiphosphoundecaprenol N-acetyl-beta-D-mannosaminyltransferase